MPENMYKSAIEYMKDKWFIITLYYNYLIDVYPLKGIIILISILLMTVTFGYLKLLLPMLIGYILITFFIILKAFSSSDIRNKPAYFNRWLMVGGNRFMFIKTNNFYDSEFYVFNLQNRLDYYKRFGITNPKKYDFTKGDISSLNPLPCRIATKKEIEKYNLSTAETKILLLNNVR